MKVPEDDLILSTLRGLLRNVFPELRAVCVESRENLIFVCFYCDGEISDDNKECCESTLDDIFSDFSYIPGIEFDTPIIRLDYPKKMPLIGEWVYYRHEDSSLGVNKFKSNNGNLYRDIKITVQRSLLGNIFPNLRSVCVETNDHLIRIYFYHEYDITEKEIALCQNVIDQMLADFSKNYRGESQIKVEKAIIRVDFPKKMLLTGYRVFYRQEDSSQYVD